MTDLRQEIISIKRSLNSLDGKIISYLKSNPLKLGLDFAEVVTLTLKTYWLPLALFSLGVRGEELRQTAIWAVKQLEAQAGTIRQVCGLEEGGITLAEVSDTTTPASSPSKLKPSLQIEESSQNWDNDDNDEDDDLIQLEWPEELKQANKALGFGN